MKKNIILVFIFALLIRLINLNQSFWLDEAVVAKVIRTIPFHLIPITFSPGDFHPPFYYLFMSLWSTIFGYTEIALRMPSIIASLLTGWIVFKISLLISNKKTAFWAMLFFLFNPLIIYYSQEARMYMMVTFFLTVALYYFVVIVQYEGILKNPKSPFENTQGKQTLNSKQIPNRKLQTLNYMLIILFIALGIFTFYGSLFFIAVIFIYSLVQQKYKIALILLCTTFLSILLLSPLLLQQFQTAKSGLTEVKNWSLVLGKAHIKNLLMIFVKFTSGRLSWDPKLSYYLVVGSWSLVVGFFVFLGMKKNKLLTYIFILPLVIAFFISFFIPMLQYFRFLYLIPVMSLLLAKGINRLSLRVSYTKAKQSRYISRLPQLLLLLRNDERLGLVILLAFIFFSLLYLLNSTFHREDWKNLSKSLDVSKPVYMILPSSDPISYYRKDIDLKEIRLISQKKQTEKNIYVIPYVVEIYGFDYKKELTNKGCVLSKQTAFRELLLEEWSCGYVAMMLPRRVIGGLH